MGILRKLSAIIKVKKEKVTILVIGLNDSGKTTLINNFKSSGARSSAAAATPTVGFTVERFQCRGVTFTSIDMSGARRYRGLWEHHVANCHGIVYVIDASDQMRLVVVRDELETLMRLASLESRKIPLLFYCNKVDSDSESGSGGGCLSSAKLATAIGLERICRRQPWQIVCSNALSGEGLEEGVQWLVEQIRMRG